MNPIFPKSIRKRWDYQIAGPMKVGDVVTAAALGVLTLTTVAWGSTPLTIDGVFQRSSQALGQCTNEQPNDVWLAKGLNVPNTGRTTQ